MPNSTAAGLLAPVTWLRASTGIQVARLSSREGRSAEWSGSGDPACAAPAHRAIAAAKDKTCW
jgi:hypothetical protein